MNPFDTLIAGEEFEEIDHQFARFVAVLARENSPELTLAAALVSRSRGEGNVCFDLKRAAGRPLQSGAPAPPDATPLPLLEPWVKQLKASGVVGNPGDFTPLVIDHDGRLYLHRYWEYETRLAAAIRTRATRETPPGNLDAFRSALDRFFPPGPATDPDQRLAAETTLTRQLTVLTGGPGTGKTRTIALILALLNELSPERFPRIALAAPTGKAAARMQESIARLRDVLPCSDAARRALPTETFTLHRLLRITPGVAEPRFNRANPLPYDVVVIDEASMVDLALMAKLFDALASHTRVILVGDKDQLASVEAGAVLGDLCHGLALKPPEAPLARCLVQLRTNHRFQSGQRLEALRRAIYAGEASGVADAMRAQIPDDSSLVQIATPSSEQIQPRLRPHLLPWFREILAAPDSAAALACLGRFRILCALRVGPHGSDALNHHAETLLAREGLIPPGQLLYPGRPVLITRNDPTLGLSNGDVGLLLPDSGTGRLRAWFSAGEGALRSFPPARLGAHETTFAMTVHKAQGSEFERVLLVLPDKRNPVLTRELLYTGITRARESVELWAREEVLGEAVQNQSLRSSGLRAALWGC